MLPLLLSRNIALEGDLFEDPPEVCEGSEWVSTILAYFIILEMHN